MQRGFDSGPAVPVAVAISEPPIAPVAVSFDSSLETEPSPAAARKRANPPSPTRLLASWAIDLALIVALLAAQVLAAALVQGRTQELVEIVAGAPASWVAVAALLAAAWSWVFIALWCRTPGMALTGQRLHSVTGGKVSPVRAMIRAVLAVAFAATGLLGFVLALFDPRRQTLHDKICRCFSVVD